MSKGDPMKGRCGAKTRSGGRCKLPAGHGTSHVGVGRCKLHGGATPQAEVAGAVELARREALVMGQPLDIAPHDALLECIRIAAGEVRYASDRIAELSADEAVGPIVTTRPRRLERGEESATERVEEHGPPQLHVWVRVRHEAMDRLANYSRIALAAGIAERQVRLAEAQAHRLAEVVAAILRDLGHDLHDPSVREVVRARLIEGSAQPVERARELKAA